MIVEQIVLVCLVILAVMSLSAASLRRAVIYLAVFSLLASFAYLLYRAPDVAIAEAVIGCGLATVLYLVALKRQRLMTIYYVHCNVAGISDSTILRETTRLLNSIEQLFAGKDLETQVIHTTKPYREILEQKDYDLMIVEDQKCLSIYGRSEDYHLDEVSSLIADYNSFTCEVAVVRQKEEGE